MRWIAHGLLYLICGLTFAASKPDVVTLCREDQDDYPWLLNDRPGHTAIMLKMVSQKLAVPFQLVAKPWKRCLFEMQHNLVDGVVNASFTQDRSEQGVFPMLNGRPDPSKRTHLSSYSLYRLKGTKISWDGNKFNETNVVVGAQTSFTIVDQLRKTGLQVDDSIKSPDLLLQQVMRGAISVAALQTEEGNKLLANNPQFHERIEKLPVPFVEKPYYLMLSKQFVSNNPGLSKKIWDTVADVRDSPEFAKQVAPLLLNHK